MYPSATQGVVGGAGKYGRDLIRSLRGSGEGSACRRIGRRADRWRVLRVPDRPGRREWKRRGVRVIALLNVVLLTAAAIAWQSFSMWHVESVEAQDPQESSYTITIESVSVAVGDTGSVNVEMVDISGPQTAWDVRITYDPSICLCR